MHLKRYVMKLVKVRPIDISSKLNMLMGITHSDNVKAPNEQRFLLRFVFLSNRNKFQYLLSECFPDLDVAGTIFLGMGKIDIEEEIQTLYSSEVGIVKYTVDTTRHHSLREVNQLPFIVLKGSVYIVIMELGETPVSNLPVRPKLYGDELLTIEGHTDQYWGSILKLHEVDKFFNGYWHDDYNRFYNVITNHWSLGAWWITSCYLFNPTARKLFDHPTFVNELKPSARFISGNLEPVNIHMFNLFVRLMGLNHLRYENILPTEFPCCFPTYYFAISFFTSSAVRQLAEDTLTPEQIPLVLEYAFRVIGETMLGRYHDTLGKSDIPFAEISFHYPVEAQITRLDRPSFLEMSPLLYDRFETYKRVIKEIPVEEYFRALPHPEDE